MVRTKKLSKNFWHDIDPGIDIPEIIKVIVDSKELNEASQNEGRRRNR